MHMKGWISWHCVEAGANMTGCRIDHCEIFDGFDLSDTLLILYVPINSVRSSVRLSLPPSVPLDGGYANDS